MTSLGALAFPMFILHGPIGQIFYKKTLVWHILARGLDESLFAYSLDPFWGIYIYIFINLFIYSLVYRSYMRICVSHIRFMCVFAIGVYTQYVYIYNKYIRYPSRIVY